MVLTMKSRLLTKMLLQLRSSTVHGTQLKAMMENGTYQPSQTTTHTSIFRPKETILTRCFPRLSNITSSITKTIIAAELEMTQSAVHQDVLLQINLRNTERASQLIQTLTRWNTMKTSLIAFLTRARLLKLLNMNGLLSLERTWMKLTEWAELVHHGSLLLEVVMLKRKQDTTRRARSTIRSTSTISTDSFF